MPKQAVLAGNEVCALLEKHGFVEVRRRGSHIVMPRQEAGTTTTVPVPDHDPVRRGTLRAIIRQSGLPREIFEV